MSMSSARERKPVPLALMVSTMLKDSEMNGSGVVFGDDHHIGLAKLVDHALKLRTGLLRAKCFFQKDALSADRLQRRDLSVELLILPWKNARNQ